MARKIDAATFIRDRLPLEPVPGFPDIRLHRATPDSGIGRLIGNMGGESGPPYWAYVWAGGLAIAYHLGRYPEIVQGKMVLDLGSGSGLLGIVAARLGAARVIAADTDPLAQIAIPLNAAANCVSLEVTGTDLLADPSAMQSIGAEVILAGDIFYDQALAVRSLAALRQASLTALVLIGDPGRAPLPRDELTVIAEYPVPDMGDPPGAAPSSGLVLTIRSNSAQPRVAS